MKLKRIKSSKIIDEIKKSSIDGFDDLIIDVTRNRIMQELALSSMLRTRGGILIAFAGVVLGIILTGGWDKISAIVIERAQAFITQKESPILFTIALSLEAIGAASFLASIVLGFMIILPRRWPAMLNPEKINNELANMPIKESKHAIKCELIGDLKNLLDKNSNLASWARVSYWFLISGLIMLGLVLFFNSSSIIVKFFDSLHT